MKKVIAVILILSMCFSIITGCSSSPNTQVKEEAVKKEKSQIEDVQPVTLDHLPADEKIKLVWWIPMVPAAAKKMKSYNEAAWVTKLEEATGVDIEFIHPTAGKEKEQFNLLVASGKYPDIITVDEGYYQGGPSKAIADGVYLELTDLVDQYAPDYKKVLESDKEINKQGRTLDGKISFIKCIQTAYEPSWVGPVIRKDLLDTNGLEIPTTIEDWDNVLKVFKDNGIQVPLSYDVISDSSGIGKEFPDLTGTFISAFGVHTKFYQENGVVKYGPLEDGYKQYLQLMNRWLEEGLLDPDFATRDTKGKDSLMSSGKAGAFIGTAGKIIKYEKAAKKNIPDFELVPLPYPSSTKGEVAKYKQSNNRVKSNSTAITTSCKYPELALQLLNFGFTDEGYKLFNYGGDEKYFTVDDNGNFDHSEFAVENYGDLRYDYKPHIGPFYRNQTAHQSPGPNNQRIIDIKQVWDEAGSDLILPALKFSLEESSKFSSVMVEITTYVEEMSLKFILGVKPIDEFDNFAEQIKRMNIEEALEIQQNALDRYNK